MTLRKLALTAALALGLTLSSGSAMALNSIYLTPIGSDLAVGDFVDIQVSMSFDDPTFGGGLALTYDQSVLSFNSFVFDSSFTANFGIVEPAAGSTDNPLKIQFGWFFAPSPIGETVVGTFRFNANSSAPMVEFSSSEILTSPFAGLLGDIALDFGSTQIVIVPEPGTALLLMSGLGLLSALRRRGE